VGQLLQRLFQPRQPAFWFMVALNALSMVLVWVAQTPELSVVASLLIAAFALGNAALGAFFAWQLLRRPAK
jgi:hypothetical protein